MELKTSFRTGAAAFCILKDTICDTLCDEQNGIESLMENKFRNVLHLLPTSRIYIPL